MYESISKNNELENEMTLDMSYFWYSDAHCPRFSSFAPSTCILNGMPMSCIIYISASPASAFDFMGINLEKFRSLIKI